MSPTAAVATAERLGREAARYLAVVEAFRDEGCQPLWRAEPVAPGAASRPSASADAEETGCGVAPPAG
jgi:hypothetical protein